MEGSFVEFQQRFTVENYVGDYQLVSDEYGIEYIKSKEKGPKFGGDLEKKKVFEYSMNEENSIVIKIGNLILEDDDAVLDFCNQYGLPWSSQIIFDENKMFKILDVEIKHPLNEYDSITKEEFVYHCTVIKSLLTLKEWINDNDVDLKNVYSAFLFLLLFQWYPVKDEMLEIPKTITGKFQKYVLSFDDEKLKISEKEKILYMFLASYEEEFKKRYKESDNSINSLKNITQEERKLYLYYKKCLEIKCDDIWNDEDNNQISAAKLIEYIFIDRKNDLSYLNNLNNKQWVDYYNLIQLLTDENRKYIEGIDSMGIIQYNNFFKLTEEQNVVLKNCARQVLCDSISENIKNISPILEIKENGDIVGNWSVKYLYEGMCLEIYLMMMTNERIRVCANPKCRKFFPASQCRNDKKFCSTRCLNVEMKRRQRRREKENKKLK